MISKAADQRTCEAALELEHDTGYHSPIQILHLQIF